MLKILLSPEPAESSASPEIKPTPAPASSAEVVNNGPSNEAQIKLEAENKQLKERVKKLETDVAHLQDANKQLREAGLKPTSTQPAKEKISWMGFGSV